MFKVKIDGYQLLQALKTKGGRVIEVLMTRSNALMFQLQSKIVSEKLSGQVLARRTGVLAASVQPIPATLDMEGLKIRFGVQAGGGPAFYAATHEFGGSRAYEIVATKARALHFLREGREIYARRVMHGPAKTRPFMTPAVEEFLPTIREELNAAVQDVLKE